jgi:O-antigen/teichoic acid export membrane protein
VKIKLYKEPYINILVYYGALILNIFLGWALAKLNTQYLEVAAYGQFSFFITFVLLGRSFFDFGVFESISRLLAVNEDRNEEKKLIGTSLFWAIIFALVSVLILFISGGFVDTFFQVKIGILCRDFSYAIGLFVLVSHLSRVLRGSGRIFTLGIITLTPRFIYLIFLTAVILYGRFTLHITLTMMFWGILLTLISVWIYLKPSFQMIKTKSIQIWKEVKSYGSHIFIGTMWAEILIHADKFIISYFLNSQDLAYYALAFTLSYPLSYFSTSLATGLFNRFATDQKISKKLITGNLIFVSISVILFIILRKPIIQYLFSEHYIPTIALLLPLALAFGFSGLSKPYILFLMAHKQGKIVRNISILIPSIQIVISIIIIPIFGIIGIAWVTCFVYALDLFLFLIWYRKFVKSKVH